MPLTEDFWPQLFYRVTIVMPEQDTLITLITSSEVNVSPSPRDTECGERDGVFDEQSVVLCRQQQRRTETETRSDFK